jgi:hypothetical protein
MISAAGTCRSKPSATLTSSHVCRRSSSTACKVSAMRTESGGRDGRRRASGCSLPHVKAEAV